MPTTQDFFDQYAKDFNAIYGNENTLFNRVINRFLRRSMYTRFVKTLEGCSPIEGRSVVDIGCGPGHYGVALARMGARHVYALDFAPGMVDLARRNARSAGVADRFQFVEGDFMTHEFPETYDYAILMGFMDYMEEAEKVVRKALSIARKKIFISFPAAGGFLAWQRQLRYKRKCELYPYRPDQIRATIEQAGAVRYEVEKIQRDYFVTIHID
jgi:SAM-dependent methyltransferase